MWSASWTGVHSDIPQVSGAFTYNALKSKKKDIHLGGVLAVPNTNFWTQSCKSSGQYSANTFNSTQFSYNKKKRWWRQFAKLYHTLKTCCLGGCSFEDASEQTLPHPNIKILQCTMSPLSTRNCFKSNKVRPISNCWFCHLIYKKICLNVFESKQRREKLVFVIL